MSLKHYVFMLMALLVLILASTQLLFIHYIQQQVSQEVEDKSRALSKQALKLLVDTLPDKQRVVDHPQYYGNPTSNREKAPAQRFKISLKSTPNKSIELGDGYRFVSGERTQTLKVSPIYYSAPIELKEQLVGQLQSFEFQPLNDNYAFSLSQSKGGHIAQHIVQFGKQDSAIHHYFNGLIFGTIIFTFCVLLLAYWLARHISRPLQALSQGFHQLQLGLLGHQVTPSGVQEMQETMDSFNAMSNKLLALSQMEKRFAQQQQLAELGEVARGVAHTLRNPINTLGLAVEQISQTNMPQSERLELAKQVRDKISRLDTSIKSLLSLTAQDIQRDQPVDLNQVIQDIVLEMSMSYQHTIHFFPKQRIQILGAEVEIRAMIHTLVVNAIEASDSKQAVSIEVCQNTDWINVQVTDYGPGVDPAIHTNLFKPHITNKPEGAGMGLYIAQRICQLHYQGNIELKNQSPVGCVASLTLANAGWEAKK
ncbi:sensor histidine kinase [Paraglaciecola aestuariivivens]